MLLSLTQLSNLNQQYTQNKIIKQFPLRKEGQREIDFRSFELFFTAETVE